MQIVSGTRGHLRQPDEHDCHGDIMSGRHRLPDDYKPTDEELVQWWTED